MLARPRLVVVSFLAALSLAPPPLAASVVFDNFDPDGGFAPRDFVVAADAYAVGAVVTADRAAARFTVSGGNYLLSSVTLPIARTGDVSGDRLRVRLCDASGEFPGATLEVLSVDQPIWPALTDPFDSKTTLVSATRPLLRAGHAYWVVTELSGLPALGANGTLRYVCFENNTGTTTLCRQQPATGALPADPWSGIVDWVGVALRVDGTPTVIGVGDETTGLTLRAGRSPSIGGLELTITLPDARPARLELYDPMGRRVRCATLGAGGARSRSIRWDALPAGVYLARLVGAGAERSIRVVVLR